MPRTARPPASQTAAPAQSNRWPTLAVMRPLLCPTDILAARWSTDRATGATPSAQSASCGRCVHAGITRAARRCSCCCRFVSRLPIAPNPTADSPRLALPCTALEGLAAPLLLRSRPATEQTSKRAERGLIRTLQRCARRRISSSCIQLQGREGQLEPQDRLAARWLFQISAIPAAGSGSGRGCFRDGATALGTINSRISWRLLLLAASGLGAAGAPKFEFVQRRACCRAGNCSDRVEKERCKRLAITMECERGFTHAHSRGWLSWCRAASSARGKMSASCSICSELLQEKIGALPCGHVFHTKWSAKRA